MSHDRAQRSQGATAGLAAGGPVGADDVLQRGRVAVDTLEGGLMPRISVMARAAIERREFGPARLAGEMSPALVPSPSDVTACRTRAWDSR